MFSDTNEYTPWYQNRRITIPAILILLVIAAVLLYVFVLGRGLAFSVDFKDIKGLTQGSPLYWNGLEIGRVTGIGPSSQPSLVRVDLVADRKYQDDLHVDSVFQVIAAPVAGGKYPLAIQVEVVNPASTAIPRGTVFTGANNPTEAYLQAAKYAGTDAADKFLRLGDLRVESTFQPGAIERTFVLETGLLIPAGNPVCRYSARWRRLAAGRIQHGTQQYHPRGRHFPHRGRCPVVFNRDKIHRGKAFPVD